MNDQTLWGTFYLLYLIPFSIWAFIEHENIAIKEKLYPGRSEEKIREKRLYYVGGAWFIGLTLLLLLWKAGAPPVVAFLIVSLLICVPSTAYFVFKRWHVIAKPIFRVWVASTITWSLTVLVIYIVFERSSSLKAGEFFLLGMCPPIVFAIGLFLFSWARIEKEPK
jgi:hypothetical protein